MGEDIIPKLCSGVVFDKLEETKLMVNDEEDSLGSVLYPWTRLLDLLALFLSSRSNA